MRHLKTYEVIELDIEKLAIGAIESYIEELFFKGCKEFAFVQHNIEWTNVYFSIEFHSITLEVIDILKELTSFFNIEFGLEHGEQRIIQFVIIDKTKLKKYADNLEVLATSKKYNI